MAKKLKVYSRYCAKAFQCEGKTFRSCNGEKGKDNVRVRRGGPLMVDTILFHPRSVAAIPKGPGPSLFRAWR